ncbi:5'-nucleotidase, partial [Streptomyces goshikiensis]
MRYDLSGRLVVGIASSALFDLTDCDAVFREQGEDAYRAYQEAHADHALAKGVAFPFVRRLLSLNDLSDRSDPLVEVIILSRNDPDTGLRVMRSITAHHQPISRAVFRQGRPSHSFMRALNMSLFLSANGPDVRDAVAAGLPPRHLHHTARKAQDYHPQKPMGIDLDRVLAG